MNLYGVDYSLFDVGFTEDPIFMESLSRNYREREENNLLKLSNSILKNINRNENPPQHRHDGTSPLPLGMDWSPPPHNWNGPSTIWPHDFHTGWSYCVTIPSWSTLSESEGSEPVVFYRVQVGLQSPEGVTTTRGVLRRFNDFLKLSVDLKRSFRKKKLPATPTKGLLRMNSRILFEERRCSLEEWMAKVLSDIDISRSVHIACFLELEAAARSSFYETTSHHVPEFGSQKSDVSDDEITSATKTQATISGGLHENNKGASNADRIENHSALKISPISATPSEADKSSSSKCSESVEASESPDALDLRFSNNNTMVVLPTDEKPKMNRLLDNMKQRLGTSTIDMENLIARLNQELAVREYLTTKVNDLETELESTKKNGKENIEQAVIIERERYTQIKWDMEELSRKCIELELGLKSEQEKRAHAETTKTSILEENEALRKELDSAKEQLKNIQKCHEESDLKSKSDVKLLVKEVKSLRNSQSELTRDLEKLENEKTEFEMSLQKERQGREHINTINASPDSLERM
ncbi:hypothetical protein ACJIZ3_010263 [Penstemon smallii]|uniref:PX domain-containing protein n=1 Tax=Penstemon smallii TaxID=265156 RepID=A0ABD3TFG9_9LAMI